MDIQNIPRIYTGFAEITAAAVVLLLLASNKKRIEGIVYYVLMLTIQCAFLYATGGLPRAFWLPCMFLAVVFMYLYIFFHSKKNLFATGYYTAKAFLMAEFTASFEWQLHIFILKKDMGNSLLEIVFALSIMIFLFFLFYKIEKLYYRENFTYEITYKEAVTAFIITALAFALSNLSYLNINTPFTSEFQWEKFIIRTLSDLGGLAILFAFQSRIVSFMDERELLATENALRKQYDLYRNYRENLDLFNIKYHDLKHEIIGLRSEDGAKKDEWIDAIEEDIESYFNTFRTGNAVLDSVIESKIARCKKNAIRLTCVLDGELLSFMHVRDICTVFGNALDNAIESAVLMPQEEERLIHITTKRVRDFVYVKIENYCGNLEVESTDSFFPKSTKKDAFEHGYGLKSIRYTMDKYQGSMNWEIKDGWFILNLLFPYTHT